MGRQGILFVIGLELPVESEINLFMPLCHGSGAPMLAKIRATEQSYCSMVHSQTGQPLVAR
jgi:hypothetical protein